jgi:hypothetical protein
MLAALNKDAQFPSEIDRRMSRGSLNSLWKEKMDLADALLAPSIPKGQRTQIYDEPETGLALPVQGNLFDMLHQTALHNDFQVIVASHSPACLGLAGVHYIDMEPGYLAQTFWEVLGGEILFRHDDQGWISACRAWAADLPVSRTGQKKGS